MKTEFSLEFSDKYLSIKFDENSTSGSRHVFPCGRIYIRTYVRTYGRTDGRTDGRKSRQADIYGEANSRFSQFCISA